MTDSEIIRAIADDRGWKVVVASKPTPDWPDSMWNLMCGERKVSTFRWWNEKLKQVPSIPTIDNCLQDLPRWLTDHNAAHELIEVLRGEGWCFSANWDVIDHKKIIIAQCGRMDSMEHITPVAAPTFCRAVCEAYLKVRGKWIE